MKVNSGFLFGFFFGQTFTLREMGIAMNCCFPQAMTDRPLSKRAPNRERRDGMLAVAACWQPAERGAGVESGIASSSCCTVSFFYQSLTLRTKCEVTVLAFGWSAHLPFISRKGFTRRVAETWVAFLFVFPLESRLFLSSLHQLSLVSLSVTIRHSSSAKLLKQRLPRERSVCRK